MESQSVCCPLPLPLGPRTDAPLCLCVCCLTWQYKREPVLTRARLVNSMLMGLVLGLVYFQQEATYKAVQNKLGVLFIITINQTISSMFGVVQVHKPAPRLFYCPHLSA